MDMVARYVSNDGNDANDGLTRPTAWATLQHATDSCDPGDSIYVAAGTYPEIWTWDGQGFAEGFDTTVQQDPTTTGDILLDRTNAGGGISTALYFTSTAAYLTLKDIVVVNDADGWAGGLVSTPVGIAIVDGAHHITIQGVTVHDVRKNDADNSYALPVLIYSNTSDETHHITLNGVEVYDCDTYDATNGVYHASISIAHNVQNLLAVNCYLHDVESYNGSGFEIGGNQSATASPNRPRDLVIRNNRVVGQQQYGIYCTATVDTLIEGNRIEDCVFGVGAVTETGASFEGLQERMWIRGNILLDCQVGIVIGAWAPTTYSDVDDVYATFNTIRSHNKPTGSGGAIMLLAGNGEDGIEGDSLIAYNVIEGPGQLLYSSLTTPAVGLLDRNLWIGDDPTPFYWDGASTAFPYDADQDDNGAHQATSTRVFRGDRTLLGSRVIDGAWPEDRGAAVTPSWYSAGLFGDYEPAAEVDLRGQARPATGRTTGAIEGVSVATTTIAEICDAMIAAVKALTPPSHTRDRYRLHDDWETDIREAAEATPRFRLFSVRTVGNPTPPLTTNTDEERVTEQIECVVAYPRKDASRYGRGAARGREALIELDAKQIDNAIGTNGYQALELATGDAAVITLGRRIEPGAACVYLVLDLQAEFTRSMS